MGRCGGDVIAGTRDGGCSRSGVRVGTKSATLGRAESGGGLAWGCVGSGGSGFWAWSLRNGDYCDGDDGAREWTM